jgi:hypothetical protein
VRQQTIVVVQGAEPAAPRLARAHVERRAVAARGREADDAKPRVRCEPRGLAGAVVDNDDLDVA